MTTDNTPLAATDALAAAAENLDAKDGHGALAHLLVAWRACRSARIAASIDRLSSRLGASLASVEEKKFHDAWMKIARSASDADVPRLLPGLLRAPLGDKLIERVRVMTQRAPDPRVAAGFMAMVDEPPATSQSIIGKLWGPIFTALETIGDGRQRVALENRLKRQPDKTKFWPQHYRKIEALLKKLSAPPEPDDIARVLARIDERIERADVAALSPPKKTAATSSDDPLEIVYADPLSIDARLVCADRLMELGDPRAELIVVQKKILDGVATSADRKTERDLIRQHGERFLPTDLAPVLTAKQYGFHLGFLGDCEVIFSSDAEADALVSHRAWRTVRELYTDEVALLTRPDLVALDCIGSFDPATLVKVAECKNVLPVTRVGPIYFSQDRADFHHTNAPALPHVKSLEFFGEFFGGANFERWAWLVDEPLAQRATAMSFLGEVHTSFVRAFELFPKLERIDFAGSQRRYRLERLHEGEIGLWIGMHDSRLDGLIAMNEHHAREIKKIMSALKPLGVRTFVLADSLSNPLKKALPLLAADLGIPHVPERNEQGPTYSDLTLRDGGRRKRQAKAKKNRT